MVEQRTEDDQPTCRGKQYEVGEADKPLLVERSLTDFGKRHQAQAAGNLAVTVVCLLGISTELFFQCLG